MVGTIAFTVDSDDRAVSDVIAFVLVFSIIITSVGFVYAVGFGALTDLQENEQNANAERSMSALAVAMDDILRERSGDRAADIDLAGETIAVDDRYELQVTVDDGDEDETDIEGALVYGVGSDTRIVYMAGAVIRVDPGGAIVTRGPMYTCRPDADRAVVSAPTLEDEDDEGGISADGSVRVEAAIDDRLGSTLGYPESATQNGDVESVEVSLENAPDDIEGDLETALEQWFERQNGWEGTGSGGECDLDDGTAFVRNAEIDISYLF